MSDLENIIKQIKEKVIEYNTYRIIANELENIEKDYLKSEITLNQDDNTNKELYYKVFKDINTKLLLDKIFSLDEKNKNSFLFSNKNDYSEHSEEEYRKHILISLMSRLEQNIHCFIDKKISLKSSLGKNTSIVKSSDFYNINSETVTLLNNLLEEVMNRINSFHSIELKQLELNESALNVNISVATNTSDDIYNYVLTNLFSDEFHNCLNSIKSSEACQIQNLEEEIEKLTEKEKLLNNQSEEYTELVKEYRKLCNLMSIN